MAKPTKELNKERYFKEVHLFFKTLASECQDTEDCKAFLRDLLTESELRMLKKRWYIARLLRSGMDVRSVAAEAEVSTTTVVRISHILKKEGGHFRKVLDSLGEEEHSSVESSKVSSPEENIPEGVDPKSRYVFGHE